MFFPTNVLEGAVLTLTPDGAVAGKGVERLTDRDIGLECEDAGAVGARVYLADLGLGPYRAVSTLVVAGLAAGVPLVLEWSADGSAWTSAATLTLAAAGAGFRQFSAVATARYWRWTVTDPPVPARLTEVTLGPSVAFTWKPSAGTLREPELLNVSILQSVSGRAWGVQRGARRWSTSFVITGSPDTDRVKLLALLDELADTAKPFWTYTVTGELRYVRLLGPIEPAGVSRSARGEWDIPITLVEELP